VNRPTEPPPCEWSFPSPDVADTGGLVAVGGDLAPGTLLAAYRTGLFPMPVERSQLGWWSPDPRGVIPLDGLRVTKSVRRSLRRYDIRTDTAFASVMVRCADPSRPHGWITRSFVDAYARLHDLGWAHSVEAWRGDELVGGLYGVAVGGLFAGESMFHTATDASKVALVHLVALLHRYGYRLLDVQWVTPHLASLGAVEVTRTAYLDLLAGALAVPGGWDPPGELPPLA
jgi:leucyl/phenylalanyl-tRNA---protein transferase